MTKRIEIKTLAALPLVADEVFSFCPGKKIFAFLGDLGSGKTTVIGALCRKLGVTDKVSSPTFAIINEYKGVEPVYHMDLYRLKSVGEALETGIEEYLGGDVYCFIEWPQLIESLLPDDAVHIFLETVNENERLMIIERP